ncbi:hypothetical protein FJY71_08570, partial [candidate division WOR-3 bacterium]|nr:hypothetical protein [candidate division WOR-3 bacterium]
MEELTRLLSSLPQLDQLLDRLRGAPLTTCAGAPDGVIAFVAGRVAVELARPVVIVCESDEAARDRHAELAGIYPQVGRLLLDPTTPALPSRLAGLSPPAVVVVTAAALDAPAPVADDRPAALDIRPGCGVGLPGLAQWLEENGYQRTDLATERGEYAVRGGIVDVFPDDAEDPVRIEIGDELVVSLRAFDPLSQRSRAEASDVSIPTRRPARSSEVPASTLLPVDAVVMTSGQGWGTATTLTIAEDSNADCDLGCRSIGSYMGNADLLRSEVERSGDKYYVVSGSSCRLERLSLLLGPKPRYLAGPLSSGFACPALHAVVLTEREVYGTPAARRPRRRFKGLPVDNLIALRPGDHVVHIDYGVGMFEGTRRMMHAAVEKDYIVLKYAGRDRVYVPVENLSLLDRYVGGDAEAPALDRLGGRSWLMAKAKAARASAEYAKELLDLHARRRLASGTTFPVDTHDQAALEAAFPWQETPDQLTALAEVKRDMQS